MLARELIIKYIVPVFAAAFAPSMILAVTQPVQRPNIIFIMSDDHASHAISAYGSRINKTPNIDRIARDGMRFNNCFCVNSLCAPSRAVILTGKHSHINGVIDNEVSFDGGQQTLPKLLQQSGYQTAIVGKWHLKSPPTGFDYSNILPGQGKYNDPDMIENGELQKYKGYATDIITDSAISWLKRQESSVKPFFLMLHHKAPHANWESDEKHMNMYTEKDISLPETFYDDYKTRTSQIRDHELHIGSKRHIGTRFLPVPEGLTEKETKEWAYQIFIKRYLRCVASIDDNIGRVLDYLDKSGMSKNTIIIYTSDQGFFLGDHGIYDKRFMYESSLRMPFLIRYTQEIKAGSTTEAIVSNLDFASTILDFAHADIPEDIQGRSFKSIALGSIPDDWQNAMYYRFYEEGYGIGPHEGIRCERYKLIHFLYGDQGWELYDLEKDPDELNNIYNSPEKAGLIKNLKAQLSSLKDQYKVKE